MERLAPLVGEWTLEASLAPEMTGRCVFEWVLGGAFLMQRSEAPDPAPDGLAILAPDPAGHDYVQHYFDSRGVVRIYGMSFENGVWKLWRDAPDFTPLDFHQRFTGTLSDDGNRIDGRWESSDDGSAWEVDFDLMFTRVG
jgi:hypothetical protein